MPIAYSLAGITLAALHSFLVASIPIANCTQMSTDAWALSLGAGAPLGGLAALLLAASKGAPRGALSLSVLLLPLMVIAAAVAFPFFMGTTIKGLHLCHIQTGYHPPVPAEPWQRVWAPVQFALLGSVGFLLVRLWQRGDRGVAA